MWTKFLLLLAVSSHVLGATLTITASSSTSTTVRCLTQKTDKSFAGPVPTSTRTQTQPVDIVLIYSASTPVSTVTRKPSTVTLTSTFTRIVRITQMGLTSTFTSTLVQPSTTTLISTVSDAETITLTGTSFETSTAFVTASAPAGFRGIEETAGDTDYAGAKRDVPALPKAHARPAVKLERKAVPDILQNYKYPKSVTCIKSIRVTYYVKIVAIKLAVTKTVKGTTTTVLTRVTTTSTSTVAPNVSSTITVTSYPTTITTTSIYTPTVTETTSTTILTVSTSTVYAACAPTNILGPRLSRGDYTYSPVVNDPSNTVVNSDDSALNPYDCCNFCHSMATPGMACLYTQFIGQFNGCNAYFDITGVCSVNTNAGFFQRVTFDNDFKDVYSNGPCGFITEGPQI